MNTLLNRRTILMTAALGAGTTLLQACGGGDDEPQRNIVEIAQSNPDLSILVEAVVAAGLAQNLSTGSLTVFAPTNAAFAALLGELGPGARLSPHSLLELGCSGQIADAGDDHGIHARFSVRF